MTRVLIRNTDTRGEDTGAQRKGNARPRWERWGHKSGKLKNIDSHEKLKRQEKILSWRL